MDEFIKKFVYDVLDIKEITEYEFVEKYGFTFVVKREVTHINDKLSSVEIIPLGIIYDENGEYYYAPLHVTTEIDAIVKKYVEEKLK